MNSERIKEVLDRIPYAFLLVVYLGYLGFQHYTFLNDASSPLGAKKVELEDLKKRKDALDLKLKVANDFLKNIDSKRMELRTLAAELQSVKDALPDFIDIPLSMKMLVTEAKKVGLAVQAVNPKPEVKKDFYCEQPFSLKVFGTFIQVLAFIDRLANVSQLVVIEGIEMTPVGSQQAKYVAINVNLDATFYRYRKPDPAVTK